MTVSGQAKILVLLIGEVLEDPRVLKTCMSLRKIGADVTVACTNPSGKAVSETWHRIDIKRFPHGNEFILKRLYNRFQSSMKPGIRRVISQIHEEVPVSPIKAALRNTALSMNFSHTMKNKKTINRMMADTFSGESFDLVHCNDVDTLRAGSALKSTGAAKELLYDAHEFWPGIGVHGSAPNTALRNIEAKFIGNADLVLTVNTFIAKMMQEEYGLDTRPAVVMNCPEHYSGPVHTDHVFSPVRVLYQGKVQAFRGLENLVLAFKRIVGAELTISGYGPLTGRLELLAASENLAEKVRVTGRYSPDEALSIITDHDIGVLPFDPVTLSIMYSSPNKLFDYAMGGLAMAASTLPFLQKFIEGNNTGMLFRLNEPDFIARVLNDMISDTAKLKEYKRNARKAATESYFWDKQFNENYPWKKI